MGDLARGLENLNRVLDGSKRPGRLKLSVLSHITDNFSDDRKIGEGGCGHVYKGILPSGKMVAVKKLFKSQTIDERMFLQEVTTMMSVKHQNIVRFIGYCSQTEQQAVQMTRKHVLADETIERLLCFDYIRNGSLEDHITDELRGLEWHTRFQIIKGICEGVHHLHKEKSIIHMDLKPANILLNDDWVPKISDFGISRPGETSETKSEVRMYSPQYCAPEYKIHGRMSFMSDIYSLGVIIKEIVTGSREEKPNVDRVQRRWRHRWKNAKHMSVVHQQQVTKCLELAQWCTNLELEPTERPDILLIIHKLNEMDSTPDISNTSVYISTSEQQRNSFLEDMLRIEPLELHFTAEHNKQTSGSIKLTNDTDDYIAFRISLGEKKFSIGVPAPAPIQLPLCVHPNNDVVPPRSSCRVTVTLEAVKKTLQQKHCIEEFCVQSTRVDKGVTSKPIPGDMFKEEADKVVDMVNLMVKVRAPKQLLIVDPLELRYGPIEPNKPSPCLVQLTNMTDDYVAFMFVLPQQGKVLYYHQAMGMGIMPPWSTRGVVVYMLVKEEAITGMMQCNNTCIVRSVVVDKGLNDDDVSVEFFDDQMGVHEMELEIVFAEQPQAASSSVRHPMFDDEQHWEAEDELEELLGDRAMLVSPFLIVTELLHIYPAELHFASEGAVEYISLANKTDDHVIYAINYCDSRREDEGEDECEDEGEDECEDELEDEGEDEWEDEYTLSKKKDELEDEGDIISIDRGVMPPQSTRVVPVPCKKKHLYDQVGVMMISGSHRYGTADDFYNTYTYNKREELMSQVRAEGGKVHEVLLACVVHAPPHPPESVATDYKQQHQVILSMDEIDIGKLQCMDVHPTEPWIVSGHEKWNVCIWKMDPETGACEERMMSTVEGPPWLLHPRVIGSVKFIARMQWVVCSVWCAAWIIVLTYADNRLTQIQKIEADHKEYSIGYSIGYMAVHPTLPYLLCSGSEFKLSQGNMIQLWDWDKGFKQYIKSFGTPKGEVHEVTFDPKDAYSFASLYDYGEINVWSIHKSRPIATSFCGDTVVGIAYCNTGTDMQRMLATVCRTGKIEILDLLRSNITTVETPEAMKGRRRGRRWAQSLIVSHPTLPLLATAEADPAAVLLWNYTSYGLKRVNTFHCPSDEPLKGLGFIDIEGFQRLVIATEDEIHIVDILDGATLTVDNGDRLSVQRPVGTQALL